MHLVVLRRTFTAVRACVYELYEDAVTKAGCVLVIEVPPRPVGKGSGMRYALSAEFRERAQIHDEALKIGLEELMRRNCPKNVRVLSEEERLSGNGNR